MPSLNRVQLMGHMARDSEMRYTPSGKAVTNFSIATSWGSGDNKKTDFHNCVIWDSDKATRAQWASKFVKGDLVYVEGRLTNREWEDQNGNKRRSTEIVCDRADFLRNKQTTGTTDSSAFGDQFNLTDVNPDDIPF